MSDSIHESAYLFEGLVGKNGSQIPVPASARVIPAARDHGGVGRVLLCAFKICSSLGNVATEVCVGGESLGGTGCGGADGPIISSHYASHILNMSLPVLPFQS